MGEVLTLKFKASGPLIFQWDEKLLEDSTEEEEVDLISIPN